MNMRTRRWKADRYTGLVMAVMACAAIALLAMSGCTGQEPTSRTTLVVSYAPKTDANGKPTGGVDTKAPTPTVTFEGAAATPLSKGTVWTPDVVVTTSNNDPFTIQLEAAKGITFNGVGPMRALGFTVDDGGIPQMVLAAGDNAQIVGLSFNPTTHELKADSITLNTSDVQKSQALAYEWAKGAFDTFAAAQQATIIATVQEQVKLGMAWEDAFTKVVTAAVTQGVSVLPDLFGAGGSAVGGGGESPPAGGTEP